jgi:hypothetical protein
MFYVGLPRNVNDFYVLNKFELYQRVINEGLFDMATRA